MRTILATAVAASAAMLTSGFPAAAQAPPAPRWGVDWGEQYCTLARLPADGAPAVFALRVVPGSDFAELFLFPGRSRHAGSGRAELVLMPEGHRTELHIPPRGAADELPMAGRTDVDAIERLQRSSAVHLVRGDETLARIPLPGARSAVAALRRCMEVRLVQWRIDPAAQARLRSPPERHPESGTITNEDYPASAVREHAQGTVVARLDVNPLGRVTACAVVASSGHSLLDEVSCRLMRARFRFTPAIGPDGRPTAAPVIRRVRWELPD